MPANSFLLLKKVVQEIKSIFPFLTVINFVKLESNCKLLSENKKNANKISLPKLEWLEVNSSFFDLHEIVSNEKPTNNLFCNGKQIAEPSL